MLTVSTAAKKLTPPISEKINRRKFLFIRVLYFLHEDSAEEVALGSERIARGKESNENLYTPLSSISSLISQNY